MEQERRRFYIIKSDISTLENQKSQKEKYLTEFQKESQSINQSIAAILNEINYEKNVDTNESMKIETISKMKKISEQIDNIERKILENEKRNAVLEMDVKRETKLKSDIIALESCPICKQNVGEGHKHKIATTANIKIDYASKEIETNLENKKKYSSEIANMKEMELSLKIKLEKLNIDGAKLESSEEKRERVRVISKKQKEIEEELILLDKKIHGKKIDYERLKNIEEEYDETRLSLQEISFTDMDVDSEIQMKKREIGRLTIELKSTQRDMEDSKIGLRKIQLLITEKANEERKKEKEERELYKKSQKFFDLRNSLQDQQKVVETDIIGLQHSIKNFEDKANYNKIQKAQLEAHIESLNSELSEFASFEPIALSVEQLKERLQKSQFEISKLGNVNLRALEVFDKVEEQVALIEGKVKTILREKEQIEKIVQEIDKKKKKSFFTTLYAIDEYFTRNFSQLSKKGEVLLELENKKNPFDGGLNISIKVSKGKYLDVTSLSGGEQPWWCFH